ncbi:DUF3558 domain-containing protein [Rhodococcus sp. (in: high G+C Gram-positive bacteria)]|uniref:DUF3558 domain-containing protein n=1 Tax=Rhodococcus sp. TaxID=1831 RepID=UPI003315D0AF
MGVRGAVVLVAAALLVGGCSSTVEGHAVRPDGTDGLFDPCSAIPDEVISGLGADVASEETGILGVRQGEFEICTWMSDWYQLGVWSTFHTLDDVRRNPNDTDIRDAPTVGAGAITFRELRDVENTLCVVAIPVEQGSIFVRVDALLRVPHREEICGLATRHAVALRPYLPN